MASETCVSDHPAATPSQEEVEKEVNNKIEHGETTVFATPCPATASDPVVKDNDDGGKPKAEETAQAVAPLAEEKIIDELIVPPPAEELEKAEAAEEKPVEQPLPEPAVPALEKLEDKPVEVPPPAQLQKETELVAEKNIEGNKTVEPVGVPPPDDKKIEDVPVWEVPADKGIQEVVKGANSSTDGKSDEKSEPDHPVVEPKVESINETAQESAKNSKPGPVEELKHELVAPPTKAEEKPLPGKSTETIGEGSEPKDTAKEKKIEVEAENKPLEAKPEEKSVVAKELVQCEQKPTEGVTSPASLPNQPAEKPEVTSRDIEPVVVDNGKKKEEKSADRIAKDVKVEEVAATAAKPEDEKRVDEPARTGIKDDSEETKATQDKKGPDVLTKPPTPSIVKIVKQSLAKAKKAITGRSNRSSKTPAPETKDQENK